VRITEVPDSQKTWGDPSGGKHRGKGVRDTNDCVENIQAARGSCTAQEIEPIVYNKHKWNMSSNKKKAHLPRLCTAGLAGARSWFCSIAPTSFHTHVYSLLQGRQDPGHHMTKAGILKPAVGGASGAIPSPSSRSCCCPPKAHVSSQPHYSLIQRLFLHPKQAHKIKPHAIPSGLVPTALLRQTHPQTHQAPLPDP